MKKLISGKIREVYETEEHQLLIVTTDRISAFDVVFPTKVPNKGKILNQLSLFWFNYTKDIVDNHILSEDAKDFPEAFQGEEFQGRTVLAKKLKMLPYEFIVRGYIFGNMWNAYKETGGFCGYSFREGYILAEKLELPVLTPSVKVAEGHDEYIPMDQLRTALGDQRVNQIEDICLRLYNRCYAYAYQRGIIIADTKFELGLDEEGRLVLADEIFTPDSSRFWDLQDYKTGVSPKSYDKQFLRDWLLAEKLNGVEPAPEIPEEILRATGKLYEACLKRLVS